MSAGDSAYDVARKQREKAARLERSAALWEQDAAGEVAVARALAELPPGWVVLHDLAWPGRPRANIDHVVVGPGGVFVVDAKNWTGRIDVREQVLRQNGRAREEAVVSAAEAAIALQGLVPTGHLVSGVLCFVRDEAMTGWARDVMVCTTANMVAMLGSRPTVLNAEGVDRCARSIRSGTSPRGDHPSLTRMGAASHSPSRRGPARTRTRQPRRRRTPWLKVVAALTFLALLIGGGLTRTIEWGSERLVDSITPTQLVEPNPEEKRKRGRDRKKNRTNEDAAGQG